MDDVHHLAERIIPKNFTFDADAAASFSQKMYACASISILANLVGFYLIVRHSPPSMALYRWCLLDISVCSLLFDLHVSIFYQPLPLFPVPLLCTAGAARYLPPYYSTVSQISVTTITTGFLAASIFTAFFFRLLAIYNRQQLMKKPATMAFLAFVHFAGMIPIAIATASILRDDTPLREALRMKAPTLPDACCLLTKSTASFVVLGEAAVTLPYMTITLPFVTLATASVVEIPFAEVIIPLSVNCLSLHSFCNAVAMIAVTKPYRSAVADWLGYIQRKPHVVTESTVQPASGAMFRRLPAD
ncbi:hypothetical protein AAVH_17228 [Aphelenchoides avenae]|nr:hypothetical protein AAVH_17228 [Aphelenchus avenae]